MRLLLLLLDAGAHALQSRRSRRHASLRSVASVVAAAVQGDTASIAGIVVSSTCRTFESDALTSESVLLASPANRIADHIQALGRISKFMADPTTRDRAYRAPDAETLYALLTGLDAAARS